MLLVLLVCAAPVIASYFTYFVLRPAGPQQLRRADRAARAAAGRPAAARPATARAVDAASLQGQWLLVVVGRRRLRRATASSACTCSASCARCSAASATASTSSGWSPTTRRLRRRRCAPRSAPAPPAARAARAARGAGRAGSQPAPGEALEEHLYLVDPMGDWMMRVAGRSRPGASSSATSSALLRASAVVGPAGPLSAWTRRAARTTWRRSLRLALLGVALALGPLAWVWLRHRGADAAAPAARADAADAVPDLRPGAVRRLHAAHRFGPRLPRLARLLRQRQPARRAARRSTPRRRRCPSGPVTHGKAWIEMIHRYLGHGGRRADPRAALRELVRCARRRAAAPSPWWATLTLVWVCVQGAFGALTVTMKLYPAIVTLHLLGGLGLLALLAVQSRGVSRRAPLALPRGRCVAASARWPRWRCCRSRSAAGSAPTTRCWPAATSRPARASGGRRWTSTHGFTLRRELGDDGDGGFLPFAALTAIHMAHRARRLRACWPRCALLAWRLHARGDAGAAPLGARRWPALALWQLASGLSNVRARLAAASRRWRTPAAPRRWSSLLTLAAGAQRAGPQRRAPSAAPALAALAS